MPLIDRLDSAISSRNGRGDSCFLIDQAEFAKDAIGKNRFEMESINDYVDLSFLDDVHLFPFVSLFENGCPGRERLRFRSICVDIADSHRVRICVFGTLSPTVPAFTNCLRYRGCAVVVIFAQRSLLKKARSILAIELEAKGESKHHFSVLQDAIPNGLALLVRAHDFAPPLSRPRRSVDHLPAHKDLVSELRRRA
jgi:hypothetical protein